MPTLQALYQQNPVWVWVTVAAFFVALNLATGWARMIWPMLAALLLAALHVAGAAPPAPWDWAVFAVLAVGALGASFRVRAMTQGPLSESGDDEDRALPPG
jgi:membrane protein implicated in regulation of membrane protease activity